MPCLARSPTAASQCARLVTEVRGATGLLETTCGAALGLMSESRAVRLLAVARLG
jgi:hypothetical protein